MQTKAVEKAMRRSLLYSFALTQSLSLQSALAVPYQAEDVIHQEPIEYGDHGELVRHIQLKLKKLGYYNDRIDGQYGLYTEQAVRSFQSSEAITISGQINKDTFQRLQNKEKQIAIKEIKPYLNKITYGETSSQVEQVQEVLYFYGYYKGKIDGIYGNLTKEAIERVKADDAVKELFSPTKTEEQVEAPETEINTEVNDPAIVPVKSTNPSEVISVAKSLIGTPYKWGGTSRKGFDCSGFIQYVFDEVDLVLPRTVRDIWNFTDPIDSPSVGDFVFFETYEPGPSHMGIYIGEGQFIHASTSKGVRISHLEEDYWKQRYLGAKRIKVH